MTGRFASCVQTRLESPSKGEDWLSWTGTKIDSEPGDRQDGSGRVSRWR